MVEDGKLILREVEKEDMKLLFEWANDKSVRQNALNTERINLGNHKKWFFGKINSPNSFIFILEKEKNPIGQIRFDKVQDFFEIDYSIDKKHRGQGYGKLIVKMGIEKLTSKIKNVTIKAIVKQSNIASEKVFLKLGFIKQKGETSQKHLIFIYEPEK